ncbi:MAG: hypothetical protein JWM33_2768 [Caulobacteraceae bacterium]|nr:hypothetical protein [Caulobacteraceae bacterium]
MPPTALFSRSALVRALGVLAVIASAFGLGIWVLHPALKPPPKVEPEVPVVRPVGVAPLSTSLCAQQVDLPAKQKAAGLPLSGFTIIPGSSRPWITPLGGGAPAWTLDELGRYVPYASAPSSPFHLDFAVEKSGRVVALGQWPNPGVFADTGSGFHLLVALHGGPLSIAHNPRLNLTLVAVKREIFVLRGETLSPWSEGAQVGPPADGYIASIHDLPLLRAMLFETSDGSLLLRPDEGGWVRLPPLKGETKGKGNEVVYRVSEAPRIGMVVLNVMHRTLGLVIDRTHGPARVTTTVLTDGREDGHLVLGEATGDLLRLRTREGDQGPPVERYRQGWEAVAGVPASPILIASPWLTRPAPPLGGDIFATTQGLGLYDGDQVRLLNREPDLGARIEAVPTADDRGMVVSTRVGMRVVTPAGATKMAAPFTTGGVPFPALGEKRSSRVVLAAAREGLFSIDARGRIERIPGGETLGLGFVMQFLGELPVSGDAVLSGPGGIYLVRAATTCSARSAPGVGGAA